MPHLGEIEERGGIEAVVLTHSHIDHSGALPVVFQRYDVPLYLTPATLSLIQIMLLDALKVMEIEREEEIPLYSLHEVEKVMAAARPVPFRTTIELFGGDVKLSFFSAGHILGAAYVVLYGRGDGTLMVTGDVSVTDQITVPGMDMVSQIHPDLLVIESTYGGRLHTSREIEEDRLVEKTSSVVSQGGAILFPSFAVGRAQEIILILSRAMEDRKLPRVPIVVDGLVKNICKVYTFYPELVKPLLRKQIMERGNPFFYEGATTVSVWDPQKREEYARMRPAIIVSSSGMLSGGPSPLYARELSSDPRNFIGITGYQDEESPGRRLQEIAEAGEGELKFGETETPLPIKCGIGTYKLSAHADTTQLLGILKAFAPKKVALVHGDAQAREQLYNAALRSGIENVCQPRYGEDLVIEKKRRPIVPSEKPKPWVAEESQIVEIQNPLKPEDLMGLARKLAAQNGRSYAYTIQEILAFFGYPPEAIHSREITRVEGMLHGPMSPFKRDKQKKFLYRIKFDQSGLVKCGKGYSKYMESLGRWHDAQVLQRIKELFPPEAKLYKRSFRPESNALVLTFHFPRAAQKKYAREIQQLQEESKWDVIVSDHMLHNSLIDEALRAIPSEWPMFRTPSLFIEEGLVLVTIGLLDPPVDQIQEGIRKFNEKTGFDLRVVGIMPPAPPIEGGEESPARAMAMEINTAFAMVKASFRDDPHRPLKVGLQELSGRSYLELAFLTPQLGARFEEKIRQLEKEIGWAIRIKPMPDQDRLRRMAGDLLPKECEIAKSPACFESEQRVEVYVLNMPEPELLAALEKEFLEKTAYRLSVKPYTPPQPQRQEPPVETQRRFVVLPLRSIVVPARDRNTILDPVKTEKLKIQFLSLGRSPKPILVKKLPDGRYLLLNGLRRISVAQDVGHDSIDAYIIEEVQGEPKPKTEE